MRGMAQPCAVLEHAKPRRRKKTHLRRKLSGLLAPTGKLVAERTIEEDDGLATRETVLRATEAKDVDAGSPRQIGGAAPKMRHCVGEARAIHLHFHIQRMRDFG